MESTTTKTTYNDLDLTYNFNTILWSEFIPNVINNIENNRNTKIVRFLKRETESTATKVLTKYFLKVVVPKIIRTFEKFRDCNLKPTGYNFYTWALRKRFGINIV